MQLSKIFSVILLAVAIAIASLSAHADDGGASVDVGLHQAKILKLPQGATNVEIANGGVASVVNHGGNKVSVVGRGMGDTSVKYNEGNKVKTVKVKVSQDLPAIRKSLAALLPDERIGVELVNRTVALTGNVSSAEAAARAVRITEEYVKSGPNAREVLNLMQISSGQQVMLKVKVGELRRSEIKRLGLGVHGIISGEAVFGALESNGAFKTLAEPTLTAISGESAQFLAGGEFPIPVAQPGNTMSVDYKNFGVSVDFTPYVISSKRVRLNVASEVSEISDKGSVATQTMRVPSISTRRANTTVELAPGESFMIAGLIKNNTNASIHEVPGLGDIPILNALFRSAEFNRNESELVIAVTPYLAEPVPAKDIKLPTDGYVAPSMMEMMMLGKLQGGKVSGRNSGLEGPSGFAVD